MPPESTYHVNVKLRNTGVYNTKSIDVCVSAPFLLIETHQIVHPALDTAKVTGGDAILAFMLKFDKLQPVLL